MTSEKCDLHNIHMPCPCIGPKQFWTGPNFLDVVQNVKFSSEDQSKQI
jgi:hypothetical protein